MTRTTKRSALLALTVCAVALAACGDDDGGTTDAGPPPPPPPADTGTPPPPPADMGPPGDGGMAGPPTCSEYCSAIMTNCTGTNTQYNSVDLCMAWCSTNYGWDVGMRGDTTGNSLGCRLYHGGVAAAGGGEAAMLHCPHGGPSGGNVCGSWCDNYCYLVMRNCTTEPLYPSMEACATACAGFDDTGAANASNGDTVQCRIYHAGVAGGSEADAMSVHCPHSAEMPSDLCI